MPDLKNFSVAPVQIWGLKDTEYQRRLRAEARPHRICAMDGETILSRWNNDKVCGPCRVKITDEQAAPKTPTLNARSCTNCGHSYIPLTRTRRWCYDCAP